MRCGADQVRGLAGLDVPGQSGHPEVMPADWSRVCFSRHFTFRSLRTLPTVVVVCGSERLWRETVNHTPKVIAGQVVQRNQA